MLHCHPSNGTTSHSSSHIYYYPQKKSSSSTVSSSLLSSSLSSLPTASTFRLIPPSLNRSVQNSVMKRNTNITTTSEMGDAIPSLSDNGKILCSNTMSNNCNDKDNGDDNNNHNNNQTQSILKEGGRKQVQSNLSALLSRHVETSQTITNSSNVAMISSHNMRQQSQEQPATFPLPTVIGPIPHQQHHHGKQHGQQLDEADFASGPPMASLGCHSAPTCFMTGRPVLRMSTSTPSNENPPSAKSTRMKTKTSVIAAAAASAASGQIRRYMSSKGLECFAPPSGPSYVDMLHTKEALETRMRERLHEKRESNPLPSSTRAQSAIKTDGDESRSSSNNNHECSSSMSRTPANIPRIAELANESRNRRRAEHHQAVVNDLCEIVTDLFVAESKLLDPNTYGVSQPSPETTEPSTRETNKQRDHLLENVKNFVKALPTRYALGVDTPSEVLLHMRLMAVARSDPHRAVVHVVNLENDNINNNLSKGGNRVKFLVTISCTDTDGLLEYITKLLGTGGSRVLDADVMLSSDGIVLDRFVVEMTGRLRLDKLANFIEAFVRKNANPIASAEKGEQGQLVGDFSVNSQTTCSSLRSGQVYFNLPSKAPDTPSPYDEIMAAVPLTQVLASPNGCKCPTIIPRNSGSLPELRGSTDMVSSKSSSSLPPQQQQQQQEENEAAAQIQLISTGEEAAADNVPTKMTHNQSNLAEDESTNEILLDYVKVPLPHEISSAGGAAAVENRVIPLIPFDDLMLIETLGTGRVSTIYRAAWQRQAAAVTVIPTAIHHPPTIGDVQMVALKVAMVNSNDGGTANIDELQREADIAARLKHPNVSDLVGIAADAECFCLAYDFCEGGSLLSLLSDTSRYYDYLPIALDIANGMAYLHSRNVIHRDLKPSNILLTRDHRAKIADFGMSIANFGQELTAETGTYRYMAPEVIRHESYSSNADVYSFGICLWQLITRQVPFASMTPIQAAYAVAEGQRPEIPHSIPRRLQEIIQVCWDQDSYRRPSFTYIAMALADYVKQSFSPANVGARTLEMANEMLVTVEGNATVNVDLTTPVTTTTTTTTTANKNNDLSSPTRSVDSCCFVNSSSVGLEIE